MKKLSTANWQEMDPTCRGFEHLNRHTGESGALFPDRWAQMLLALEFHDNVPENVRGLFDVARGSMLYGYYYYPLFKLGVDLMHRVAEAALSEKYRQCDGPQSKKKGGFVSFSSKLQWLSNNQHIDVEQKDEWEWVREMRNDGSHPRDVALYPPIPSLSHVEETIQRINRLFL